MVFIAWEACTRADGDTRIYTWTGLVPMARPPTRPCFYNDSLTRDALTSMAAAWRLLGKISRVMDMVSSASKMTTCTKTCPLRQLLRHCHAARRFHHRVLRGMLTCFAYFVMPKTSRFQPQVHDVWRPNTCLLSEFPTCSPVPSPPQADKPRHYHLPATIVSSREQT